VVRADPAMSSLSVLADETQEHEVAGSPSYGL